MAWLVSCFRHSLASSFERAVSARGPASAGAAAAATTTGAGAAGTGTGAAAAGARAAGFAAGATSATGFATAVVSVAVFAAVASTAGFADGAASPAFAASGGLPAVGASAGLPGGASAWAAGLATGGLALITIGGGGGGPMNMSQASHPATPSTAMPATAIPAFFLSKFRAIAIPLRNPLSGPSGYFKNAMPSLNQPRRSSDITRSGDTRQFREQRFVDLDTQPRLRVGLNMTIDQGRAAGDEFVTKRVKSRTIALVYQRIGCRTQKMKTCGSVNAAHAGVGRKRAPES